MYHPDNGQSSYKPQTKHAQRMILPSSSQKHSRTYRWVRGSCERDRRKSRISSSSFFFLSSFFLLSHTKLLTSIAYKLKQILSYFTHRTTSLSSQQPLSARLPANWQERRFWLAAVPRSCNTTPFWATNKVEVQTCTYCACAVHMLTRFTTLCLSDGCVRGAYRILVNPTSGGSRPLGGIPTNLYLSVGLSTVPSWRRGFLSWRAEHVSSKH